MNMLLLNLWGEIDGRSAVEFALNQPSQGMMGNFALTNSLNSWINADPVAAEAWYTQSQEKIKGVAFAKDSIDEVFFQALAKKDLDTAFSKLDLSNTSDRKRAIQAITNLAGEAEMRDQTIAKIKSFEDPELQQKMFEGMIQNLSYRDPDAARELLSQIDEKDPKKYLKYQGDLLGGMSMYDPVRALEYSMTEIIDKATRTRQMKSAFASLASQDSMAAKKWLADNPSEDSDQYLIQASENLRWQSPDRSMEWALQINDEDKRTAQAVEIYKRWKEEHEVGANTWLKSQHPETQEAILVGSEDK